MTAPRSAELSSRALALVSLVAFLSGMCALVYEVVWMRLFVPVFGLSIYSTTAVLTAFMGGLGLGSVLAPRVLRAWRRSPWTLYALLEVGIGVGVILIPLTIGPITKVYVATSDVDAPNAVVALVRFCLCMLVMGVPTFFMGITLPALVHACRQAGGSRLIGRLYGLNTVGGAVGCVLVGFLLIYHLGLWHTVLVTSSLNFGLALLVWGVFARRAPVAASAAAEVVSAPTTAGTDEGPRRRTVLWLYGLIGMVSIGLELCWFRILIFYLHSATYSFSLMLAMFLLGIGGGSFLWARFLEPRVSAGAGRAGARILGVIQVLLGIIGVLTLHFYRNLPDLWIALVERMGAGSWEVILFQKVLIAGVVLLPPTILMGITFPLVARLSLARGATAADTVGHLYAVNTLGAIVGSLATGFLLFDVIGVQRTVILLSSVSVLVGLVFAASAWHRSRPYGLSVGGLLLAFVVVAWWTPPNLLKANFERFLGDIVFFRESASDITLVHQKGQHRTLAFNDGRGTSSTKPGVNYSNRVLAYTAMMMNPDAKNVLVISMGCGNTSSAFTQFPIERLDIVDISSGPFEVAHLFETNLGVLDDPRVHTHVEDGRNYLLRTKRKYDIIEIDLPTIHTEGVVNLYTREFYEIARAALADGGLLLQWIDVAQAREEISYMLVNTMIDVFPRSLVWAAGWQWWVTGVNQEQPIRLDYEKIAALFADEKVQRDVARVQSGVVDVLARLVASGEYVKASVGDPPLVTDDRTIVDFLAPKLKTPTALGGGVGYYSSPLQPVFERQWKKDGTFPEIEWGMFPFHGQEHHLERAALSLQETTEGFPRDLLEQVWAKAIKWSQPPAVPPGDGG